VSPVRSHIDETDFASFLEKLRSRDERSWYRLDFVLKRIICKWLNKKNIPVDESNELYNSIISVFYEKLTGTQFETFKNLKSYVFSIAENKVKEYYRYKAKQRRGEHLDDEHYSKYLIVISNASKTDREEQLFRVERYMEMLSPKERKILSLVYREGRPIKEVAGLLSIGESNARVIKHRALEKIKEQMFNTGDKGL
jgi:RNA polymerase sigma-70 factor (ECF subfamily)